MRVRVLCCVVVMKQSGRKQLWSGQKCPWAIVLCLCVPTHSNTHTSTRSDCEAGLHNQHSQKYMNHGWTNALNAIIINFNTKTIFFCSHVVCGIFAHSKKPFSFPSSKACWCKRAKGENFTRIGFNLIHLTLRYFYL